MRTLPALAVAVGLLLAGCDSASEGEARTEAIERELEVQRRQLVQLQSQLTAERERLSRLATTIQSRVEELDRTLNLASTEIWGDGSSTGSHLSTAKRTLDSLQAEVDDLVRHLNSPTGAR